ncbi:hypothetical protein C8R43DRAFT_1164265 [Mycena crocata]|nr:hypothetical protein C8R43DRAFT_1164265 [Mycena crocata]
MCPLPNFCGISSLGTLAVQSFLRAGAPLDAGRSGPVCAPQYTRASSMDTAPPFCQHSWSLVIISVAGYYHSLTHKDPGALSLVLFEASRVTCEPKSYILKVPAIREPGGLCTGAICVVPNWLKSPSSWWCARFYLYGPPVQAFYMPPATRESLRGGLCARLIVAADGIPTNRIPGAEPTSLLCPPASLGVKPRPVHPLLSLEQLGIVNGRCRHSNALPAHPVYHLTDRRLPSNNSDNGFRYLEPSWCADNGSYTDGECGRVTATCAAGRLRT